MNLAKRLTIGGVSFLVGSACLLVLVSLISILSTGFSRPTGGLYLGFIAMQAAQPGMLVSAIWYVVGQERLRLLAYFLSIATSVVVFRVFDLVPTANQVFDGQTLILREGNLGSAGAGDNYALLTLVAVLTALACWILFSLTYRISHRHIGSRSEEGKN